MSTSEGGRTVEETGAAGVKLVWAPEGAAARVMERLFMSLLINKL
jgi:hypothetical protein